MRLSKIQKVLQISGFLLSFSYSLTVMAHGGATMDVAGNNAHFTGLV